MILSDVVAIALSIIGFLLSLQGLWLVCRALWPGKVELSVEFVSQWSISCFAVGLLVSGVLLAVATVASKAGGPGKLAGFVILFFHVIFSGIGTSGLVTHIGRRLESPADLGRPWRATVRGGVALELACLIPVLGWFGILPIALIIGAGAATMAMFSRAGIRERRPLPMPPVSSDIPRMQAQGVMS
jgi:hypothetical protein